MTTTSSMTADASRGYVGYIAAQTVILGMEMARATATGSSRRGQSAAAAAATDPLAAAAAEARFILLFVRPRQPVARRQRVGVGPLLTGRQ